MASKKQLTGIRPWIQHTILASPNTEMPSQILYTIRHMSGLHTDGSVLKLGTDLSVSINVRFTKGAVDAYSTEILSQSVRSHQDYNRAFIILQTYWVDFVHTSGADPYFELVVDKFEMWANEGRLGMTSIPTYCMNLKSIKEKSDLMSEEAMFHMTMCEESDTDEDECFGNPKTFVSSSDNASPLSVLLSKIRQESDSVNKLANKVLTDVKKGPDGIFTGTLNHDVPLDKSVFVISEEQKQQLNDIPLWRPSYVPSTRNVSLEQTPQTSQASSKGSLYTVNKDSGRHLGTITFIDMPKEKNELSVRKKMYSNSSSSDEVVIHTKKDSRHHSDFMVPVKKSKFGSQKSPIVILEDMGEYHEKITSPAIVSQLSNVNFHSPIIKRSVGRHVNIHPDVEELSSGNPITDTQAQRLSFSGENSKASKATNTGGFLSESEKSRRLSVDDCDEVYCLANTFSNELAGDCGDYAQKALLSFSERSYDPDNNSESQKGVHRHPLMQDNNNILLNYTLNEKKFRRTSYPSGGNCSKQEDFSKSSLNKITISSDDSSGRRSSLRMTKQSRDTTNKSELEVGIPSEVTLSVAGKRWSQMDKDTKLIMVGNSPSVQEESSSDNSIEFVSSVCTSPERACRSRKSLADNEDIIMPTPPKGKCVIFPKHSNANDTQGDAISVPLKCTKEMVGQHERQDSVTISGKVLTLERERTRLSPRLYNRESSSLNKDQMNNFESSCSFENDSLVCKIEKSSPRKTNVPYHSTQLSPNGVNYCSQPSLSFSPIQTNKSSRVTPVTSKLPLINNKRLEFQHTEVTSSVSICTYRRTQQIIANNAESNLSSVQNMSRQRSPRLVLGKVDSKYSCNCACVRDARNAEAIRYCLRQDQCIKKESTTNIEPHIANCVSLSTRSMSGTSICSHNSSISSITSLDSNTHISEDICTRKLTGQFRNAQNNSSTKQQSFRKTNSPLNNISIDSKTSRDSSVIIITSGETSLASEGNYALSEVVQYGQETKIRGDSIKTVDSSNAEDKSDTDKENHETNSLLQYVERLQKSDCELSEGSDEVLRTKRNNLLAQEKGVNRMNVKKSKTVSRAKARNCLLGSTTQNASQRRPNEKQYDTSTDDSYRELNEVSSDEHSNQRKQTNEHLVRSRTISYKSSDEETDSESSMEDNDSDYEPATKNIKKTGYSKQSDTSLDDALSNDSNDDEISFKKKKGNAKLSLPMGKRKKLHQLSSKKVKFQINSAGRMQKVSKEPQIDVNMIIGASTPNKKSPKRKRRLYHAQGMLGDSIDKEDTTEEKDMSANRSKRSSLRKDCLVDNNDSKPKKLLKHVKALVDSLSLNISKPTSPVNSQSSYQTIAQIDQRLSETEQEATVESLNVTSKQQPPLIEAHQLSLATPLISLPSHQPQTDTDKGSLTADNCDDLETSDSLLNQITLSNQTMQEHGNSVSLDSPQNSLSSHQPCKLPSPETQPVISKNYVQASTLLETSVNSLPSHQPAGLQLQPTSCTDNFQMDEIMMILAELPQSEYNVCDNIPRLPDDLIATIGAYLSNDKFA